MYFFLQYQTNSADIREHRSSVAEHFPNVRTETKAYRQENTNYIIHFPPISKTACLMPCQFKSNQEYSWSNHYYTCRFKKLVSYFRMVEIFDLEH